MAQLLALEWDAREARVAVASTRGKGLLIQQAFQVDLGPTDPGETFADTTVGERIGAALAARGIKQSDALVAIGRASIELRNMSVPQVPPDELPDLVRFQAMRQFTNIGDDWPLDYVELADSDEESLSVLAASISPDTVSQVKGVCEAGQLSATNLVLRPFAASSVFRRHSANSTTGCVLIVDLLADEADLTVVADGDLAFMRTVRTPVTEDAATLARALLGEIRRTIGAAQNQLRGRRVESVSICGDGANHAALKELVEEQLSLDVTVFNPFAAVEVAKDLQTPEHPGRYAPLIGMLADEAAADAHAIDFLNPRKKPDPPNNRDRYVLYGALAAGIMLLVGGWYFMTLRAKDARIAELEQELTTNMPLVEAAQKKIDDRNAIMQFPDTSVVWLDELVWLSENLPDADRAILKQIAISGQPANDGSLRNTRMGLTGYTDTSPTASELERQLADDRHLPSGELSSQDEKRTRYSWLSNVTVFVTPDPELPKPVVAKTEPEESEPAKNAGDEGTDDTAAKPDAITNESEEQS